jgi:hypothetical protein
MIKPEKMGITIVTFTSIQASKPKSVARMEEIA